MDPCHVGCSPCHLVILIDIVITTYYFTNFPQHMLHLFHLHLEKNPTFVITSLTCLQLQFVVGNDKLNWKCFLQLNILFTIEKH
jgi:hypothetical protein